LPAAARDDKLQQQKNKTQIPRAPALVVTRWEGWRAVPSRGLCSRRPFRAAFVAAKRAPG